MSISSIIDPCYCDWQRRQWWYPTRLLSASCSEEVARSIVLGNGIQGHSVRAVESIELPSEDLRLSPELLHTRINYQIWVASTIISEFLTHPSRSHLGLRRGIISDMFADGLIKTGWPSQHSFRALPNGKSILVDGAHNRIPLGHLRISLLPFCSVYLPRTTRSI